MSCDFLTGPFAAELPFPIRQLEGNILPIETDGNRKAGKIGQPPLPCLDNPEISANVRSVPELRSPEPFQLRGRIQRRLCLSRLCEETKKQNRQRSHCCQSCNHKDTLY